GENVLTAVIPLMFNKYSDGMSVNEPKVKDFYSRVVQRLQAIPGIEAVALNSGAPLAPNGPQKLAFIIENHAVDEGARLETNIQMASADAFRLLGVPLI